MDDRYWGNVKEAHRSRATVAKPLSGEDGELHQWRNSEVLKDWSAERVAKATARATERRLHRARKELKQMAE